MTPERGQAVEGADAVSIDTESRNLRYDRWNHAVHDYVSVDLFRYVQFINREEEVMYGSDIQKVVCKACRIPENDRIEFWNDTGCDKVKEVLRRKRQTITSSFRSQFESKYATR
jgi:ethanolamine utilization protein EutP (predicted NTPase)